MKSLQYYSLAYLLIGSCTIQAMHNEKPKKLPPTPAQLTGAKEVGERVIQDGISIIQADMALMAAALNARHAKAQGWRLLLQQTKCFAELTHRTSYSEAIVKRLPRAAMQGFPAHKLKFDRAYMVGRINHYAEAQTQDKTDRKAIKEILLREKGGIGSLALQIAHQAHAQLQEIQTGARHTREFPLVKDTPKPASPDVEDQLASIRNKKLTKDVERSLDHATYHAFNDAVQPVSDLVYDYLANVFEEEEEQDSISYAPTDIICNITPHTQAEQTRIRQCKRSTFNSEYVTKLIQKTLTQKDASADDLDISLDADDWIKRAASNWYLEETNRRNGLTHSKFDSSHNAPAKRVA